tara:strand:+ start:1039 stop:1899 length:861 start_codon:yes stop_codon:yes gene_type:complete
MNIIKYFFQFLFIIFLFIIFKTIGYKNASNLGGFIGKVIGPLFRSKKTILSNIGRAFKDLNDQEIKKLISGMWTCYGKILSNYIFLKKFRSHIFEKYLKIEGIQILENIKKKDKPVIFVSGHFDNFELMAMAIEKNGIKLSAIYRPLNNIFLNKFMENIRKKYICKNQIKKGQSGTKEMIKLLKKNYSVALMIDQRVSEGIKIKLFDDYAFTTTIPAQIVKKYDLQIVPVYICREKDYYFNIKFFDPISFSEEDKIENITQDLNFWLEKMIKKNPEQWIWTHNRWK